MATATLLEQLVGQGANVSQSNQYTADGGIDINPVIEADALDAEVVIAFKKDDIAILVILADKDVTMEVNDSDGAGGSVALQANEPFIFKSDEATYVTLTEMGITADVTGLFFTETNSVEVNVNIRVVHDATP